MSDFLTQWDEFYSKVDDVAISLRLYPISGDEYEVQVGMPLFKEITQPAGMFSAPALFGLADVAGTWLAMQQVPKGVFPLAVGSSVNVVSNIRQGDAVAKARIVRAGKMVIVTDTEIFSKDTGAILAKVVTTYTVPPIKK
ncbi:PaaI family thioesterase [Corynebacterium argentoratense]|uniref:PaaI family thioesterase n=1 Tax=Corynebacterium argentoratense TaxID=42817 RepID=UPI001F351016|nr:PaaI family thioesterase [Corynebacterium argentoratense]MCF1765192.1 PaaI family thioesterase [Corynebacterium argentoratense]